LWWLAKLAYSLYAYLSSWLLASYLIVVSCEYSLLFCKSWHNGVYNCLNTCLYALRSTLILNLMHSISFFYRFVFDGFITKWERLCIKLVELFANWVVERRNMIMSI
jgi:hypothetical protein